MSDDGNGISKDDLDKLGRRYWTSKTVEMNKLGFRGEALASLVEMSGIAQIISGNHSVIFFKGRKKGNSVSRHPRHLKGVEVVIRDFMYNYPVRRKSVNPALDLEEIKVLVTAQALRNPEISFMVMDEQKREEILNTGGKSIDSIAAFFRIFGRKQWNRKHLLPFEFEDPERKFCLSGFISTLSAFNGNKQFLFVNGRFLRRTKVHRIVSDSLQQSVMCRSKVDKAAKKVIPDSPSGGMAAKIPVYFIKLTCPLSSYDISLEPRKSLIEFEDWDFVTRFIRNSVQAFLLEHKLYPADEWIKIVEGRDQLSKDEQDEADFMNVHEISDSESESDDNENGFDLEEVDLGCAPLENEEEESGYFNAMNDARQGKTFRNLKRKPRIEDHHQVLSQKQQRRTSPIPSTSNDDGMDTRSGNAKYHELLPGGKTPFLPGPQKRMRKSFCLRKVDIEPGDKWKNQGDETTKSNPEIRDILSTWKNPVFSPKSGFVTSLNEAPFINFGMRFDKEIFDDLIVIGQVDKKFISGITKNGIFVLFDQHAVHERIRLETLIRENFPGGKSVISEDVSVDGMKLPIPLEDLNLLERYKFEAIKFGLDFDRIPEKVEEIRVSKIPKCFGRRELKTIPDLISSLIRDIVENLRETRGSSSAMLPKTLHSVLCSQACRSALKFGDKIHLIKCRDLIRRLSGCSAPFQCAHGRPSIAPIVDMRKINQLTEENPSSSKKKFNLDNLRALKFEINNELKQTRT